LQGLVTPVAYQTETATPVAVQTETATPIAVQTETATPVAVQTETATPVGVQTETATPVAVQTETATPVAPTAVEGEDTLFKYTQEQRKAEPEEARTKASQVKKDTTVQQLPSKQKTVAKQKTVDTSANESSCESSLPLERDQDGTKEAYNDPYKADRLKADIALAKANKQESIQNDDFDNAKFFHAQLKALEAELEKVTLARTPNP
jgi:hypothetical protein